MCSLTITRTSAPSPFPLGFWLVAHGLSHARFAWPHLAAPHTSLLLAAVAVQLCVATLLVQDWVAIPRLEKAEEHVLARKRGERKVCGRAWRGVAGGADYNACAACLHTHKSSNR